MPEHVLTRWWPLVFFALLAACDKQPVTEQVTGSRPVKTLLIDAPDSGGIRNFPARIDAHRRAELAFRVAGKVQELLVREGDRVELDQVVAKLDPRDFEIVVGDRKATYEKNRKNFERARELVKDGHISKMDYDRLEAEFKNASAALDAARLNLDYTVLKAPFAGLIARRHIQRFEEVQAKQAVLTLQDVSRLEVKFDVPETVIRQLRRAGDEDGRARQREKIRIFATFDGVPGREFPLTFKEIATAADAKTQTFQATYTMEQVEGATILPGMTATVTVDLSQVMLVDTVFTVPVSAVVGDYKLDPRVWVIDESSMTVRPQAVKVGRLTGNDIEILDGLEPGIRIVTAGVPFLTEGMEVTLLPGLEQAEPRPENANLP